MDGRSQKTVIEWAERNLKVDFVDMITEPGPDGMILRGNPADLESIKRRILISTGKHGSESIILAGHTECAGFPVSKEEHIAAVKKGLEVIREWNIGPNLKYYGLWIGDDWKAELIK